MKLDGSGRWRFEPVAFSAPPPFPLSPRAAWDRAHATARAVREVVNAEGVQLTLLRILSAILITARKNQFKGQNSD